MRIEARFEKALKILLKTNSCNKTASVKEPGIPCLLHEVNVFEYSPGDGPNENHHLNNFSPPMRSHHSPLNVTCGAYSITDH